MPFLIVQLPMFSYEGEESRTNWAELREAQMQVFRTLRNTGLAVTMDCGEYNNMHPADKRTVAHRLALQALYRVYRAIPAMDAEAPYCKMHMHLAVHIFCNSPSLLLQRMAKQPYLNWLERMAFTIRQLQNFGTTLSA